MWALLGEGEESVSMDADTRAGAFKASAYLLDRMCVPRDMGRLAALTVRTLHKRLALLQ